jgi:hypothetical protein
MGQSTFYDYLHCVIGMLSCTGSSSISGHALGTLSVALPVLQPAIHSRLQAPADFVLTPLNLHFTMQYQCFAHLLLLSW